MSEIDNLKQNIKNYINRINSVLDLNEEAYNTIICPFFNLIKKIYLLRGIQEIDLKKLKTGLDELINNIPEIKNFNNYLLNNIQKSNISIQYVSLINSELQAMSNYFNTERAIRYINSNYSLLISSVNNQINNYQL